MRRLPVVGRFAAKVTGGPLPALVGAALLFGHIDPGPEQLQHLGGIGAELVLFLLVGGVS